MKTTGEKLQPFSINCLKETKLNIKHGVIEVLIKKTLTPNSNLNDCASTKGLKNICMTTDTSISEKI